MIKHLEQTCNACPSQWEGQLDTGEYFYVRYRWGTIRIGFSKESVSGAVGDYNTYEEVVGDGLDGFMDHDTMMVHLGMAIAALKSV